MELAQAIIIWFCRTYESETLVKWIVQLSVGVANFLLADKGLETFAETTFVSIHV